MIFELTEQQQKEYDENCFKHMNLLIAKDIIKRLYSTDSETFKQNVLNELLDDLYLLKIDLEELFENEDKKEDN